MKKLISVFLSCLLCVALTQVCFASEEIEGFSDLPSTHWAYDNIMGLVDVGGINGYSDGTFRPSNNITYAEYLTVLVRALGIDLTEYTPETTTVWYESVMRASLALGIIKNTEITDYYAPITREDAAVFTERSILIVLEEKIPDSIVSTSEIKDYYTFMNDSSEYYILNLYNRGIIAGSTTGYFNADSNLSRAEASVIIYRVLNEDSRLDAYALSGEEVVVNSMVYTQGTYVGYMSYEASYEYQKQVIESATITEENGKYYIECYLPELPSGFKWQWAFISYTSDGSYVYGTPTSITEGAVGYQKIEIVSDFASRSVEDIVKAQFSCSVIRESDRAGMCSTTITTNSPNYMLESSKVNSSINEWVSADTSSFTLKW